VSDRASAFNELYFAVGDSALEMLCTDFKSHPDSAQSLCKVLGWSLRFKNLHGNSVTVNQTLTTSLAHDVFAQRMDCSEHHLSKKGIFIHGLLEEVNHS
jgi:hypothetical protein